VKRTTLHRRTPLRSGAGPTRRKPLPRVNRRRRAQRHALQFGPQAALCRRLPCCVPGCHRRAEPHHDPSRAAGGTDQDAGPVCRLHHTAGPQAVHRLGRETWQRVHGVSWSVVIADTRRRLAEEEARAA